jgi:hypothetical protein
MSSSMSKLNWNIPLCIFEIERFSGFKPNSPLNREWGEKEEWVEGNDKRRREREEGGEGRQRKRGKRKGRKEGREGKDGSNLNPHCHTLVMLPPTSSGDRSSLNPLALHPSARVSADILGLKELQTSSFCSNKATALLTIVPKYVK